MEAVQIPRRKDTLNEVYVAKLEKANTLQISIFLFDYENKHYLVEWRKQQWTTPIEIKYL